MNDSSDIIDVVIVVGNSLGSDILWPLGYLLGSDIGPPLGLQLIVDSPYGSKVRYHDFVVSPSRATLAVPPGLSIVDIAPSPSGE